MKKKSIFIMMLMSVILSSVSFPAYAATDSFGNKIDWEEDYGYEDAAGSEILKETEIEESTEYSFSEQVKVLEQMQQYETTAPRRNWLCRSSSSNSVQRLEREQYPHYLI